MRDTAHDPVEPPNPTPGAHPSFTAFAYSPELPWLEFIGPEVEYIADPDDVCITISDKRYGEADATMYWPEVVALHEFYVKHVKGSEHA